VSLERELAAVVGGAHLLTDPDVTSSYGQDWTGRFQSIPRAVVRPSSTDEVTVIVEKCVSHGVALVPQGGNTGLTGGSVPDGDALVVSLTRLRSISEIETGWDQVNVESGASLAEVQQQAAMAGYFLPIDHSARDTATAGGSVATNAGGALAWRFGMTRAQVIGLEAVLPNGSVVRRFSPLIKNNTGYDLSQLLIGSEGTLGIVTRVRFRLLPKLGAATTVLLGIASLQTAVELFAEARSTSSLVAAEFLSKVSMKAVCEHLDVARPLAADHSFYLLLEFAGPDSITDMAQALKGIPDEDSIVAQSEDQRRRLWSYRESLNETVTALGGTHKFDVAVPRHRLNDFNQAIEERFVGRRARVFVFGHLGDGNVHLNILGPRPDEPVDAIVYQEVADLEGTISAEHGIGRIKREWLHLAKTPGEIAAMTAIKRSLDPDNLMNPGVLLPD
jgi:FAD/FMN-containing dehydrogenase